MNTRTIYTIGYTAYPVDQFIEQLIRHEISCLVDVRSSPKSAYYVEYNKDVFSDLLRSKGIHYRNYAQEFGARQPSKKFYTNKGYLDFEKFTKSELFLGGVAKINTGIEKGYNFALMCAEKDPINCHRSIMITKAMHSMGFLVEHILPDGKVETQEDIEERLINKWFQHKDQLSLLEPQKTESELIEEAYKLQNQEIGFRREE